MPRTALKITPGLFSDDTIHAAAGRWADGSNIRFRLGMPQVIGGWEALTASLLGGVCRWIFPWSNNDGQLNFGFGTHRTLEVWTGGGLYDITPALARSARALGANPLSLTNASPTVTITDAGHGLQTGDSVAVSGAATVGGVAPNGTFTVTVANSSTYTYTLPSPAVSTATGGGPAIVVTPQDAFSGGQIDGTGQAGYGTGPYGAGGYATPTVDDYFPLTWSGGAFGPDLVASPRLGAIHQWNASDTGSPAVAIRNAPDRVAFCLVAPQDQIFALGCNEEVSGEYNPLCIRHSGVRRPTEWKTDAPGDSTAREYILPGGGRIIGGRMIGAYLLVWTNASLFLGSYVGQLGQVWRFDKVGDKCGLIGPGAAVVAGQQAYWISPDRQFWSYALGGEPQPIACPIREDFADSLAAAQGDKIAASSVGEFNEVWWDYPDARDGYENSRYIAVPVGGPDAGSWFRGRMARTARVDAGPANYPLAVRPAFTGSDDGLIYADAGSFAVAPAAEMDLGKSSGGAWVGGYVQGLQLGDVVFDFTDHAGLQIAYGRTGAATAMTTAGMMVHFAADQIRTTSRGVLIEEGATNLCTWSEALDNSAWQKSSPALVVTANASAAPDGAVTADKIDDQDATALDNQVYRSFSIPDDGLTRTFSLYLRVGNTAETRVDVALFGGTTVSSVNIITWATGTVTGVGGAPAGALIPLGDGWCRLVVALANNGSGNTTLSMSLRPAGISVGASG